MASNVAIISDIRGLVTQGEDGEEILKNKDPISENGGLLTISEFAKIIFEDGREIEIEGPTQILLDSTFFENAAFIPEETTINFETLPFLRTLAADIIEEEAPQGGLDAQNDARGGVVTEQLDTQRTQEEPELREVLPGERTNTAAVLPEEETPEVVEPEVPTDEPTDEETLTPKNIQLTLEGVTAIAEGDTATYKISVSEAPTTDLTVTITYRHIDTETGDYNVFTQEVVIKAGTTESIFSVESIDDYFKEGLESYEVSISNPVGGYASYDIITIVNDTVQTTISDGTSESDGGVGAADTVYAILSGDDSVLEGKSATYSVTLVDKDGAPVTVTEDTTVHIVFTNQTAQSDDYNGLALDVIIKAGSNTVQFSTDAIKDLKADNGETYKASIQNIDTNEFENVDITRGSQETAILDGGSVVYVEIINDATTAEGGSLSHTVRLVDADGNLVEVPVGQSVVVTLSYANGTGLTSGDYTASTTVTISGGSNSTTTVISC